MPEGEDFSTHEYVKYPSISSPLVDLYIDPNRPDESWQAFDILRQGSTGFLVVLAGDSDIGAEFGGMFCAGVDGVQKLSEALTEFAKAFEIDEQTDPEYAAWAKQRYDPEVARRARLELQQQMEFADQQMVILMGERPD